MISPIERTFSKYAVVDRFDEVTDHVLSESDLLCLPKGRYHRGLHVFVELFGGNIMLQNFGGRWVTPVFGHPVMYETETSACARLMKASLGIQAPMTDFEKVSTLSPCNESEGEIIYFYNYLLDPKTELTELGDGVKEIITCPLDAIVEDVFEDQAEGNKRYAPIFAVLLNVYLTLYKC